MQASSLASALGGRVSRQFATTRPKKRKSVVEGGVETEIQGSSPSPALAVFFAASCSNFNNTPAFLYGFGATLINSPPAAMALSAARAAARSFPRRRAAIQKFGASPLSRTHALGRLL